MSDTEKSRVQINYRSGLSMIVECDDFTIKRNIVNGTRSMEWENMEPRPLLLGVEDIESVWQLS